MTSTFPAIWKQAFVRPLPKNNSPSNPNEFRPISILPTLSKALERIVHKQLTNYLNQHSLLDDYQSGFRTGHNTTTALIKINEDIREASDQRKLTILTLLDFSKAFDTLNIDLLICKMKTLNFSQNVLAWFNSYLHERQQCVLIGSRSSSWREVKAGVPQGSILGPLLFILYIDDIMKTIKHCRYHMYADDLQLYIHSPTDSINEAVTKINEDLALIYNWTEKFGLRLKTAKSQSMVIGHQRLLSTIDVNSIRPILINSNPIEYSDTVKNLGVYMDKHLNWNTQVTQICKKVFSLLHSLKHMRNSLPLSLKKTLIHTLVMPHFDYCDELLTNMTFHQTERLQRVHNECIRFVCNIRRFDHVTPSFEYLNWTRLEERRNMHSLIFLFKVIFTPSPAYLSSQFHFISSPRAQNNSILLIPQHSTSFYSSSFSVSVSRLWNSLPENVRGCRTLSKFKASLKHFVCKSK